MEKKKLYIPEEDSYFSEPYIDEEGWRDEPLRHYYVHGGFRNTEENGTEVRFCFYYPVKEKYEGRFFQYLSPAPEEEHESEHLTGEDDKITFCLTHGAYYVVSNQGGFQFNDPERLFRSSANSAQFSRKVAARLYGDDRRPYGYCFGGSGGSFKTMGCMEMTEGIWDGAVPYVMANPMAAPNVFAPRVRAMRILGEEGIRRVIDATEPGGSGDIYKGLSEEQQEALREVTRMGFPPRAWFDYDKMGDGALMVLAPYIYNVYPQYFTDFWTKEGFAGADPEGSEARARVRFETTVAELVSPAVKKTEEFTSVDNSWQNVLASSQDAPLIRPAALPPEGAYLYHCRLRILSGAAAGNELPIDQIEGGLIKVNASMVNGGPGLVSGLQPGDRILIDNSDYLAMQTLQRYQVPDRSYAVYDQYRDENEEPLYPQLPFLLAPIIANNGAGCNLTGDIHGKIIGLCSLMDESAYAWHGDWYRNAVRRTLAERSDGTREEDCFRLYYNDHCLHDDRAGYLDHPDHQVDYVGILHQALLDVAAWCENGISPRPSTRYTVEDGQVIVPETAPERGGLQPVVEAYAEGSKCIRVKAGTKVHFTAVITAPDEEDRISRVIWDFEGISDFSHPEILTDGGVREEVSACHVYDKAGTYFPVIKAASSRKGSAEDIFVQCKNLDRLRVIVE